MSPGVYTQFRDLGLPKRPVIFRPPVTGDNGPPPPPAWPPIVQDSLLYYLDADNTTSYAGSGTTWTDLSGNGYNGTLINSPIFESTTIKSFAFNGTNQNVEIPNLDLRRNFSLEIWVKFDAFRGGFTSFFGQGISDTNKSIFISHFSFTGNTGTELTYRMYNNDYTVTLNPGTSIGAWTHYVFTYNHSSPYTKKIYRNGQLSGTSGTQSQYAGTGTFYIASDYGPGAWLDGNVAVTRAYSKILSDAEVLQNYNAEKSRYGY